MRQSQKSTLKLVGLGLLLVVMFAALLYALNMCIYFAWLTATPPESKHAQWQHLSTVWFWITIGLGGFGLILVWRIIVVGRRLWRLQHPPGTCRGCGYDLSNSPDICPECGSASNPHL